MKKRSVVIVLLVALVLVLAVAGTASAKYIPKADPVVIDANCSWTHPDWATTRTGDYTFHMEWSTDAGKPVKWQVYVYASDGYTVVETFGPDRLTAAQIKAGQANLTLYSYTPGAYNTFRVWLDNQGGTGCYHDFYVAG